jgi:hypothetical protein
MQPVRGIPILLVSLVSLMPMSARADRTDALLGFVVGAVVGHAIADSDDDDDHHRRVRYHDSYDGDCGHRSRDCDRYVRYHTHHARCRHDRRDRHGKRYRHDDRHYYRYRLDDRYDHRYRFDDRYGNDVRFRHRHDD